MTKKEKKARKEHESASHVAGLTATLDAGRLRDETANTPPTVEEVKKVSAFLTEYASGLEELEAASATPEVIGVLPEEVIEAEPTGKIVTDSGAEMVLETGGLGPSPEEETVTVKPSETPEETIARLKAELAALEAEE